MLVKCTNFQQTPREPAAAQVPETSSPYPFKRHPAVSTAAQTESDAARRCTPGTAALAPQPARAPLLLERVSNLAKERGADVSCCSIPGVVVGKAGPLLARLHLRTLHTLLCIGQLPAAGNVANSTCPQRAQSYPLTAAVMARPTARRLLRCVTTMPPSECCLKCCAGLQTAARDCQGLTHSNQNEAKH